MSVRPVFLVIGSIAIVGVIGALVVRQTHGASDPGSAFMTSAAASPTTQSGPSFPTIPDGPRFSGRAAPAGSAQIAQAPTPVQPRVVLPGGVPPAAPFAAGAAAPAATPAVPPAAAPAAAQAGSGDANTGEDGQATAATQVDETALRYFARQGDTKRLEAEIARLKALYPDWYPPTDMTAPISVPDPKLDQMWKLYSTGRYAAARAAIADRVAREPGWHVPEDLLKRLDIGEAKDRLINAANAKQWNTVVQIAAATPSLLTCSDVDVLWRVAEAFAATERSARARDVGLYVLTNCQDPKERLATVQKAMQYLSDAELAELLALERVGADGRGEFAAVKTDLARRRVGAAAKDKATVAAPGDLALVEQAARDGTTADDAVLLAGYLFQHEDIENAAKWYQLARTRADTPEIARGLAYALNTLGRQQEAEAAAYRWRDAGPENNEAYLVVATALLALDPPVKLDAAIVARMAKAISAAKFAPGARELGWYAYNTGQPLAAAQWFTAALTWKPDDEPSAFGLALCYDKLGAKAALQKVIKVWGPRSQRIADIGNPKARAGRGGIDVLPMPPSIADPQRQSALSEPTVDVTRVAVPGPDGKIVVEPLAAVPAARPPRAAVAAAPSSGGGSGGGGGGGGARNCSGTIQPDRLSGAAALSRGWCLLDLNRPIEAADAFAAAMRSTSGKLQSDAAYGKSLADLRAGLTDSAAVAASSAPQDTERRVALQTEILTQRALAAYADDRYVETLFYLDERARIAPEQNDLLMIRGWSYYNLHRLPEAKRIFVSVAGTGSREALRALATLSSDRNGRNIGDVRDRR